MGREAGGLATVAYFSMEVALQNDIPTYSGGLGVLAGDHLRAAADLGLDMVGVTLLYRQGYLVQRLADDGSQTEEPVEFAPEGVLDPVSAMASVDVGGETVEVGAWRYLVFGESGQVPVYLLDTDRPANSDPARSLTGRLYGGDDEYRLRQEIVLGMAGLALLTELGHDVSTYHMNEGHSALLGLALLRKYSPGSTRPASSRDHSASAVRDHCVFTTHTPVPAGHDRFPESLVRRLLGQRALGELRSLGGLAEGALDMTLLGMGCSRSVNAVSRRHGEVTRAMFPGVKVGSVTNGVHLATWAAPATSQLLDARLPGWRRANVLLRQAATAVPLDELAAAHDESKRALTDEVAARTGRKLDPGAFTIGAARRATAYKRMSLLFRDLDRLRSLVERVGPVQVVLSGKAHPRDESGKDVIRTLFRSAEELGTSLPVVYVPGYSMDLARVLVAGADVWLNTPLPPHEASGTSGMKAALNGVPSVSLLDGWWIEGHLEGVTGWAPPEPPDGHIEGDRQDAADAEALYRLLEEKVLPLYYRDQSAFTEVRRYAIAYNASYFSTERMVTEYERIVYDTTDGRDRSA